MEKLPRVTEVQIDVDLVLDGQVDDTQTGDVGSEFQAVAPSKVGLKLLLDFQLILIECSGRIEHNSSPFGVTSVDFDPIYHFFQFVGNVLEDFPAIWLVLIRGKILVT